MTEMQVVIFKLRDDVPINYCVKVFTDHSVKILQKATDVKQESHFHAVHGDNFQIVDSSMSPVKKGE